MAHNRSLLTPPTASPDNQDIPFKADPTDGVSLSMNQKKRSTVSISSVQNRPTNLQHLVRTTSLPAECFPIRSFSTTDISPRLSLSMRNLDVHHRAWTIPLKTKPTNECATSIDATGEIKRSSRKIRNKQSPAMIVLRRATAQKRRSRTSITFFPTPQFGTSRMKLLKDMFSGSLPTTNTPTKTDSDQISGRAPAALPVCTEIVRVDPTSNTLSADNQSRRCSTIFSSGHTVYEVLWDEESSDELNTTPHKLMAQESLQTNLPDEITPLISGRRGSYEQEAEERYQKLFGTWLDNKISHFTNEAALRDVVRSKSSRIRRSETYRRKSGSAIGNSTGIRRDSRTDTITE